MKLWRRMTALLLGMALCQGAAMGADCGSGTWSREEGDGSYITLRVPVEMELDGTVYMFDPQLEWRYLHDYGRTGYNLFKMLPSHARFTYIR